MCRGWGEGLQGRIKASSKADLNNQRSRVSGERCVSAGGETERRVSKEDEEAEPATARPAHWFRLKAVCVLS